ncbi:UDP-glucose dehydrogenase family protein [Sphingomicrobium arenosum]|uniref:UDP-glucose dehydrogenase family protein n=1 Tax=Sphingomicrobium arenosum TaxID=2233861 RepID=UPI00223F884B|nr:UDP-glucose/GDP-mannose dehydrogenase family protein [Sphingomicrobium arenosum]
MKIVVIGTGYVGLVSGACFADFGHHVTCVDKDPRKIEMLERNEMPIWEPGLDSLVESNVKKGRLTFTTELAPALPDADAVFIAVGTPSRRGDGHADLTYVYAAVKELAEALDHPVVVVTKSTVPVGTGDEIEKILKDNGAPEGCTVASNPEFLREGAAIADFKHPDRILIGANDDSAREVLREVYRPLFLNKAPMLFTSRRTAELTKYAANAFLATKISFINEMADLCEAVGADVQDVARGIGLDNRIGPKFLHAGPGYGGSCFPKDTLALLKIAEDAKVENQIVSAVVKVNDDRKNGMAGRVEKALGGSVDGKTVAILGLTFKPNTDDMRDAPSIPLVNMLADKGAKVRVFDPVGMEMAKPHMPDGLHWAQNENDAIQGADALVIVTEWDEFRGLDLEAALKAMNGNVLVDLRNIYGRAEAERAGFSYTPIGR